MIAAQVGSIVLNARLLDRALRESAPRPALRAARARAARARARVLRGIGNSPGVARGRVHLIAPRLDLRAIDYEPARTPAAEWRAVQRALRETVRQLNDLRGAVGERFGEELADVFTTHIMILEDQGFRARLRRGVDLHGNGARALVETHAGLRRDLRRHARTRPCASARPTSRTCCSARSASCSACGCTTRRCATA